jgi:hypothetical protein
MPSQKHDMMFGYYDSMKRCGSQKLMQLLGNVDLFIVK